MDQNDLIYCLTAFVLLSNTLASLLATVLFNCFYGNLVVLSDSKDPLAMKRRSQISYDSKTMFFIEKGGFFEFSKRCAIPDILKRYEEGLLEIKTKGFGMLKIISVNHYNLPGFMLSFLQVVLKDFISRKYMILLTFSIYVVWFFSYYLMCRHVVKKYMDYDWEDVKKSYKIKNPPCDRERGFYSLSGRPFLCDNPPTDIGEYSEEFYFKSIRCYEIINDLLIKKFRSTTMNGFLFANSKYTAECIVTTPLHKDYTHFDVIIAQNNGVLVRRFSLSIWNENAGNIRVLFNQNDDLKDLARFYLDPVKVKYISGEVCHYDGEVNDVNGRFYYTEMDILVGFMKSDIAYWYEESIYNTLLEKVNRKLFFCASITAKFFLQSYRSDLVSADIKEIVKHSNTIVNTGGEYPNSKWKTFLNTLIKFAKEEFNIEMIGETKHYINNNVMNLLKEALTAFENHEKEFPIGDKRDYLSLVQAKPMGRVAKTMVDGLKYKLNRGRFDSISSELEPIDGTTFSTSVRKIEFESYIPELKVDLTVDKIKKKKIVRSSIRVVNQPSNLSLNYIYMMKKEEGGGDNRIKNYDSLTHENQADHILWAKEIDLYNYSVSSYNDSLSKLNNKYRRNNLSKYKKRNLGNIIRNLLNSLIIHKEILNYIKDCGRKMFTIDQIKELKKFIIGKSKTPIKGVKKIFLKVMKYQKQIELNKINAIKNYMDVHFPLC